jgi:hypothetical protein
VVVWYGKSEQSGTITSVLYWILHFLLQHMAQARKSSLQQYKKKVFSDLLLIHIDTMLVTDYLVVGAGAASMAFVDTLLTELPDVSVIMVDGHTQPGGHWNDAYGFVQLHQPSLLYGVASKQLEGSWWKLMLRGILPWQHRATKTEILAYYDDVMTQWIASGRVQYFPQSTYHFHEESEDTMASNKKVHQFTDHRTQQLHQVKVRGKLVNGVLGECRVPSTTAPHFHVSEGIKLMTPNQVYDLHRKGWRHWFEKTECVHRQYVVLGAGKTAMDTVVFLQKRLRIPPEKISWIISNDVWMLLRNGGGGPWSWGKALLENDLNVEKAALSLEKEGVVTRLDATILPTKFRFPLVSSEEVNYMRKIKNVIRRGRVTDIVRNQNGDISVGFADQQEPWTVDADHVFVHCTSPGPFNGHVASTPFVSPYEIRLEFLYAPPVPISMSCIAAMESQRRRGKLDMNLGHQLFGKDATEIDVLASMLSGYRLQQNDGHARAGCREHIYPLQTLASFLALYDQEDPTAGYHWMQKNRLSFFSIPGFKGQVYENIMTMLEKEKALGLTEKDVLILRGVASKIAPLKGK